MAEDIETVLFTEDMLQRRIAEMGAAITRDYADKDPLLIGVLSGVVVFIADLLRHITVPVTLDFMAISQYTLGSPSGTVRITKDLDHAITGRHVLFVEDVIDTGLTLSYLLRTLRTREPASIEVCVLFDRPYRRLIDIPLAYRGFELPDTFVVGYGLDAAGHYRNLPFVGALKPDAQR
ncbi:MAG TPA: hypoxanthine phosphoribosyltransferase [Chloroflexi bacterium]|nr:hypoxanthine phosphoribosyltransferase [Chloroflexota bacterium]